MKEPTFLELIEQISQEKKLSKETVINAIEQALAAAYRKDYGEKNQNIKVKFNPVDGSMQIFDVKTVVEDLKEGGKIEEKRQFNPKTQIFLSEAKKINKDYKVGDQVITELPLPTGFGRIAAQTAKQVIIQKLREAERESLYERYKLQEGKIITGTIQRKGKNNIILVDLGDVFAFLPPSEQIPEEKYKPGSKMQFYLQVVKQTTKGPEIILSRRHVELVKALFRQEIPEVANGLVEIKAIAREAGSRTKVAVFSKEKNIDPVGACIGQKGVRIQTIISQLGGEKIDIIEWNEDPLKFISNALSPAKIQSLEIDEKNKKAIVKVKEEHLSLAIGKAGQNIRLASRLTGYEIEIQTIPKEESKIN
jgi:N utilization substance protein A